MDLSIVHGGVGVESNKITRVLQIGEELPL